MHYSYNCFINYGETEINKNNKSPPNNICTYKNSRQKICFIKISKLYTIIHQIQINDTPKNSFISKHL